MPRKPLTTPVIKAIMIDPFKQCLVDIHINPQKHDERWQELLDCEFSQAIRLELEDVPSGHLIWVDESGLLREPKPYPQFKIIGANGDAPLTGYGILTGHDGKGNTTEPRISGATVAKLIQFEHWGKRLKADDYISQLMRLYLPWP